MLSNSFTIKMMTAQFEGVLLQTSIVDFKPNDATRLAYLFSFISYRNQLTRLKSMVDYTSTLFFSLWGKELQDVELS